MRDVVIFVSHAQNFEDLMLMRALGDIENGFYIDVGANDPEDESVTAVFYERGWRGINIEPDPVPFAKLELHRPEDLNLNCALWSDEGERALFSVVEVSALSTLSESIAETHRSEGREIRESKVTVTTLASVCSRHVGDRPIHFLKVDVEGSELEVFEGHDFTKWRPWIVLAEAHGPDPKSTHHEPWEKVLKAARYRFVYDDGLNRFHIAEEHFDALKDAFLVPPNIFDDWVRRADHIRLLWATRRAESAEQQVAMLRQQLDSNDITLTNNKPPPANFEEALRRAQVGETRLEQVMDEREAYHQELFEANRYAAWLAQERQRLLDNIEAIYASRSWRLAAPLRAISGLFNRLRPR